MKLLYENSSQLRHYLPAHKFAELRKQHLEALPNLPEFLDFIQCLSWQREKLNDLAPSNRRMGDLFEQQVAMRVAAFMQAETDWVSEIIDSVWLNVKLMKKAKAQAQFDVLVVTKGGSLIHLECKSATAERKDLDARLLNMYQANSSLAKLFVVIPMYTDYAHRDWFVDVNEGLFNRVNEGNFIKPVAFTKTAHEVTYQNKKGDDIRLPGFEQQLKTILLREHIPERAEAIKAMDNS